MEQNEGGELQYVDKVSLDADALQLFASPSGEVLWAPRGELCVKFCAVTPLRPKSWYIGSDVEARCPAAGTVDAAFDGSSQYTSLAAVLSTSLKLSRNCLSQLGAPIGANAAMSCVNGVLLKGEDKWKQRVCGPLEPRYEPMAFSHRRRRQRNLYYRFEVLPLGAKSCCCY